MTPAMPDPCYAPAMPARGQQQDQEGDCNRNKQSGSRPHDLCPFMLRVA